MEITVITREKKKTELETSSIFFFLITETETQSSVQREAGGFKVG